MFTFLVVSNGTNVSVLFTLFESRPPKSPVLQLVYTFSSLGFSSVSASAFLPPSPFLFSVVTYLLKTLGHLFSRDPTVWDLLIDSLWFNVSLLFPTRARCMNLCMGWRWGVRGP